MARKKRVGRDEPRWDARRLVVPALLAIAGYYAVFGGQYSIFDLRSARASLGSEQIRLEELHVEIDSLKSRADSLQHDDATIERIAREEYGMIRAGETLYRFAEARDGGPPQAQVPAR